MLKDSVITILNGMRVQLSTQTTQCSTYFRTEIVLDFPSTATSTLRKVATR